MGIQFWFSGKPFEKPDILGCLEDKKAFQELRSLYPTLPVTMDGANILIELPDVAKFKTINVQSLELKKLFTNYEGRLIHINMIRGDDEEYGIPTYVHKMI